MIEFARTHIIGRAAGHSAVKAAAYRSGTKQKDEWNGLTADYGFRAAEVAHSEILLPDGAPVELADRNTLWNEIQFAEDKSTRRSTAQLAKDHIIALPRELSLNQQIELRGTSRKRLLIRVLPLISMCICTVKTTHTLI